MPECSENKKRYCDMDKFAQSICENMTLTEDEANKFIELLWEQKRCDVVAVVRCKDCGSYNKHYSECTLNGSRFGENGFCSCGKRKEDCNA